MLLCLQCSDMKLDADPDKFHDTQTIAMICLLEVACWPSRHCIQESEVQDLAGIEKDLCAPQNKVDEEDKPYLT